MWQIGVVSPPGQEDKMLAEITGGTDWLIQWNVERVQQFGTTYFRYI